MKNTNNIKTIIFCAALVLLAVVSRFISAEMQWYNFGPIVAISLFSGALLKKKSNAFIIPLAAFLISDIFFEIYSGSGFYGISQFFVYGGMALVVLLGTTMGKPKALKVLGYTIGGSLIFWLVSNLGVFFAGYYGFSLSGLATTFLLAIPFYTVNGTEFFVNQFAGDIVFSGLLFGALSLSHKFYTQKQKAIN